MLDLVDILLDPALIDFETRIGKPCHQHLRQLEEGDCVVTMINDKSAQVIDQSRCQQRSDRSKHQL